MRLALVNPSCCCLYPLCGEQHCSLQVVLLPSAFEGEGSTCPHFFASTVAFRLVVLILRSPPPAFWAFLQWRHEGSSVLVTFRFKPRVILNTRTRCRQVTRRRRRPKSRQDPNGRGVQSSPVRRQ